jgi:hypothetical protein
MNESDASSMVPVTLSAGWLHLGLLGVSGDRRDGLPEADHSRDHAGCRVGLDVRT